MADIFISYSKADRAKVVMLSAYLESEGWSVWWDKNLNSGEPYRDEIMRELVTARAVIVLWTPTSIKSDFVRAEAGRAKEDRKLIPVKTGDVNYGDIPLPFGEMHTESLSNKELIRAAVVAQLAKPVVPPSALWVASKTLRYQALTWIGIIGGAITVFTGLRGILDLAAWAEWIVSHWQAWTRVVWQWPFALIGISIPSDWVPLLSFTSFALLIAIGQRVMLASTTKEIPEGIPRDEPTIGLKHVVMTAVLALILIPLFFTISVVLLENIGPSPAWRLILLVGVITPLLCLIMDAEHRMQALGCVAMIAAIYVIIVYIPLINPRRPEESAPSELSFIILALLFFMLASVGPAIMLAIAPARALAKRLSFLVLGLVALACLNELSKHSGTIKTLLKMSV